MPCALLMSYVRSALQTCLADPPHRLQCCLVHGGSSRVSVSSCSILDLHLLAGVSDLRCIQDWGSTYARERMRHREQRRQALADVLLPPTAERNLIVCAASSSPSSFAISRPGSRSRFRSPRFRPQVLYAPPSSVRAEDSCFDLQLLYRGIKILVNIVYSVL